MEENGASCGLSLTHTRAPTCRRTLSETPRARRRELISWFELQHPSAQLYRRRAMRTRTTVSLESARAARIAPKDCAAPPTFFSVRAMFSLSSFWPGQFDLTSLAHGRVHRTLCLSCVLYRCASLDFVLLIFVPFFFCILWNGCDAVLICSIVTPFWISTMRLRIEVHYNWQGEAYYCLFTFNSRSCVRLESGAVRRDDWHNLVSNERLSPHPPLAFASEPRSERLIGSH